MALKYRDRTELAPMMARWMARAGKEVIAECDVIIPVPLHPLAAVVTPLQPGGRSGRARSAASTGKPMLANAVRRKRRTAPAGRPRQGRARGQYDGRLRGDDQRARRNSSAGGCF